MYIDMYRQQQCYIALITHLLILVIPIIFSSDLDEEYSESKSYVHCMKKGTISVE